jgi:hypothetical protein
MTGLGVIAGLAVIALLLFLWGVIRAALRAGAAAVSALLLLVLLPAPAHAQEPSPSPAPKPKIWTAELSAGASTISTGEELKPYATLRASVVGDPARGLHVSALGRVDRTSNGTAFSMEEFKSFASIEARLGARYRISDSPVSVGGVGALTWSREKEFKGLRDPNLWSFFGGACLEKWSFWPAGGLACAGVGRHAGRDGTAVEFGYPVAGNAYLEVTAHLPFEKIPEFIRALPAAARSAPLLASGPPTPDQIRGIAQKLPIDVSVRLVYAIQRRRF